MTITTTSKFRIWSLAIGVVIVLAALTINPQGLFAKIGAAIGAAFLTWLAGIWADSHKSKTSVLIQHYAELKSNIDKIDAWIFDLRAANKDINGGLGFRVSGQSIENWNNEASAAWANIHSTMIELQKCLWHHRAFLSYFDKIESDIEQISRNLKSMIKIHADFHNNPNNGFDSKTYLEFSRTVNDIIPKIDLRLRNERSKILNDSLSI